MKLHEDKNIFSDLLEKTAKITSFDVSLIEKDYYLTIVLSKVSELSQDLVFKGGTLLNKIYFPYNRISEDLDFSLGFRLPTKEEKKIGFSPRKEILKKIETNIDAFMKQFNLVATKKLEKRDGSRQHNYEFGYNSVITGKTGTIKFEIRSRQNDIVLPTQMNKINHKFIISLDDATIKTLSLKEALADKLAATINRSKPRDFYDVDNAIRNKFDFSNKEFIEVFKKKLQDDGNDTNILKYKNNLGLADTVINKVRDEIPLAIYPVLTINEQKAFKFEPCLERINIMMDTMIEADKK